MIDLLDQIAGCFIKLILCLLFVQHGEQAAAQPIQRNQAGVIHSMQFKFGDKVTVVEGFYSGSSGLIVSCSIIQASLVYKVRLEDHITEWLPETVLRRYNGGPVQHVTTI